MATLVLTAVGTIVGGPIGGAIGAALGQQIDRSIFAPKPREGPRLKELAIQTSSYGSQIPAIFGRMRVAGTVFWATDLIEKRSKTGGSKGRPSAVQYSYSISMAVALSSRPIKDIGRIWADGNLLRGSGGDLKVDGQLRIYDGSDDQPVDPLIASAEAAGQCPAHRGIAYALFENLQLADYGNRIPSLTFELIEQDGTVLVSDIISAVTDDVVKGSTTLNLHGFAVSGNNAADTVGMLLDNFDIELSARDGSLSITEPKAPAPGDPVIIPVLGDSGAPFEPPKQLLDPAFVTPHSVTLRYYDLDRDFQASLQRSDRGAASPNRLQIELPAVLNATQARQLVNHRHLIMQHGRKSWQGDVALMANPVGPGDCFIDPAGNEWKIEKTEHRFGSVAITARASIARLLPTSQPAQPGRVLSSPDVLIGDTRIAAIEMPLLGTDDPGKPVLAVFAAGTQSGWRRAALSINVEGSLTDIGSTAAPAIMGATLDTILPHNALVIDENAKVRVRLLNDSMDLAERTGSPLDAGAPLMWIDGEFIRVGRCRHIAADVYELSKLQRQCFHSTANGTPHSVGSQFVLIQADSARLVEEHNFVAGDTVMIEAIGMADSSPAIATARMMALATKPLAPVHGRIEFLADGSFLSRWIRRSRIDFGWHDGVDQSLIENQETYHIVIDRDGTTVGDWMVSINCLELSALEVSALGLSASTTVSVQVRHLGKYEASDPLVIGNS